MLLPISKYAKQLSNKEHTGVNVSNRILSRFNLAFCFLFEKITGNVLTPWRSRDHCHEVEGRRQGRSTLSSRKVADQKEAS